MHTTSSHDRTTRTGRRRATAGAALVLALATAVVVALPSTGHAAPADSGTAPQASASRPLPGVPSPAETLYAEDFENHGGVTLLTDYRSTQDVRYRADPYWSAVEQCNGFITRFTSPRPSADHCTDDQQYDLVRAKTYALGLLGAGDPTKNAALSTNSNPAGGSVVFTPNEVEFETTTPIALPSSTGRFVTFSVDAAATDCQETHPLLRFSFRRDDEEFPISNSPIDPCEDAADRVFAPGLSLSDQPWDEVHYGRFPADSSILFDGAPLDLVLRNEATGISGNDGAIDNIRILDVTPRLDVSTPTKAIATGGVGTVTWTVTNSSELAAKDGWAFTAPLPDGLAAAPGASPATTCATDAPVLGADRSEVTMTGSLLADQTSCTVTLAVTAPVAGTHTFDRAAVRTTGLDGPDDARIRFADAGIAVETVTDAARDSNDDGRIDAGDTARVTVTGRNTGGVELADVVVRVPGLADVRCPVDRLAADASLVCTAVHELDRDDLVRGSVTHTASVSAVPTGGTTITATSTPSTGAVEPSTPTLTLDVVGTPTQVTGADTVVEYVATVANSGPVPVDDLRVPVVDDDGRPFGTATCAPTDGPLLPGERVRCSWTLRTDDADVARGSVAVSFVATGLGVDLRDDVASEVVTVDTAVTAAAGPVPAPTPAATAVPVGRPAPGGQLAFTGAQVGPVTAAALVLLLAGFGAHTAVRRRAGRERRDGPGATR